MRSEAEDAFLDYHLTKRFGSLDGVRGLSILAVIWHHGPHGGRSVGFLGVDMFFVLSGFLITTLLLRERRRHRSIDLVGFYKRRSLRILPPYLLILTASTLIALARPGSTFSNAFLLEFPYFYSFTANWVRTTTPCLGVLWSLAAEEQFYAVWPAVEKWGRWVLWPLWLGLLAVSQAMNFGLVWAGPGNMPQVTFTPILLGVALAHGLDRRWSYVALYRPLRLLQGPWMASLAMILLAAPYDVAGWPRLMVQLCMMMLLGSVVVVEKNPLRSVLGWKPLSRLGVVSYGVYLYHEWAMIPLRWVDNPRLFFVLAVAASWAVAEASYRIFELPIVSKGRAR